MFFDIIIAMDLWLITLLPVRLFWPCWAFIPWSLWGTWVCIAVGVTIVGHVYQWRCWKYLWHRPQRLRSISDLSEDEETQNHTSYIFDWWFFFTSVSYIIGAVLRPECNISWWPGAIALSMLVVYTSVSCIPKGISSSSSLSSNVNEYSEDGSGDADAGSFESSAGSFETASASASTGDASSKSVASGLGVSEDLEANCTDSSSSTLS